MGIDRDDLLTLERARWRVARAQMIRREYGPTLNEAAARLLRHVVYGAYRDLCRLGLATEARLVIRSYR